MVCSINPRWPPSFLRLTLSSSRFCCRRVLPYWLARRRGFGDERCRRFAANTAPGPARTAHTLRSPCDAAATIDAPTSKDARRERRRHDVARNMAAALQHCPQAFAKVNVRGDGCSADACSAWPRLGSRATLSAMLLCNAATVHTRRSRGSRDGGTR